MILRRAFYYWQFIAALVLPVWLFVGWGVFGDGGWGILGLFIAAPIVFLSVGAIALIVYARPAVRAEKAVSWTDVGVLAAWHLAIVGVGFFGPAGTWLAILGVLLAIVAFWVTLAELVTDGARRVKATLGDFEATAYAPAERPRPDDDGEVIIVREVRNE